MDEIKVGLDFGTHQTKICIRCAPDEGHGEPRYEFFSFIDLQGEKQYFLPSIIQVNEDNTLSYGFVDKNRRKSEPELPQRGVVDPEPEIDIESLTNELYEKYATNQNIQEDKSILEEMLKIRLSNIKARNKKKEEDLDCLYELKLREHRKTKSLFRYFKQATFIGGEWNNITAISNRTLCVWYLAYVIFLLERKYGINFSINMGVPTDETSYIAKKRLAVEILASSYKLVEEIYNNDFQSFLNEKVDVLLKKTEHMMFTNELKEDYNINIFPEAYASLIALTSRRKLPEGMSLTADIGGGTTDISFFTIENEIPMIYKYWSIPRGLNYVAERSGFDYSEGDFSIRIQQEVIDRYNRKKHELVCNLIKDLHKKIREETNIPVQNLKDALKNRILVYSGGGSTYDFLTKPIDTFTDIRIIDKTIWNEENVKDRDSIESFFILLTTAYGLSVCKKDDDVKLKNYSSLFAHLPRKQEKYDQEVSKDQC